MSLIDRTARGADPGDLVGQGVRPGPWIVGQPVTQSDAQRFVPVDASAGEEQCGRGLTADGRRQGHRQAEALVKPQAGEVGRVTAVRRPHSEVAGHGQTQASADGRPLDGYHQRQGTGHQGDGLVVEGPEGAEVRFRHVPEVEAGAEVPFLRAEDGRPATLAFRPPDRLEDAGQESGIEVVGGRAVHLHLGHVGVIEGDGDIAERLHHRSPPSGSGSRTRSATSASTSSVCWPLRAAGRRTMGPRIRENRTGWGITLYRPTTG